MIGFIAVALECALRAGDKKAFAHFAQGVVRTSEAQRAELDRCAVELDRRTLGALAAKLRALRS